MDWKVFFEKILVEYKKSPVFNIYLAPEHTAATQELTKQKIVEIQSEVLVTKSATSVTEAKSFIRYEDIYYVYMSKECLIVTAAVGSRTAREVVWLKNIRDTYLRHSLTYFKIIGGLERIYYSFSPTVSRTMIVNRSLKEVVRTLFIVPFLKLAAVLQIRVVHRIMNISTEVKLNE